LCMVIRMVTPQSRFSGNCGVTWLFVGRLARDWDTG
jgi:hypothetical protein